MEKRSTKIAYFVALGIFIVLLVILGLQFKGKENPVFVGDGAFYTCLLYTSPSPRDGATSRMPSSA